MKIIAAEALANGVYVTYEDGGDPARRTWVLTENTRPLFFQFLADRGIGRDFFFGQPRSFEDIARALVGTSMKGGENMDTIQDEVAKTLSGFGERRDELVARRDALNEDIAYLNHVMNAARSRRHGGGRVTRTQIPSGEAKRRMREFIDALGDGQHFGTPEMMTATNLSRTTVRNFLRERVARGQMTVEKEGTTNVYVNLR